MFVNSQRSEHALRTWKRQLARKQTIQLQPHKKRCSRGMTDRAQIMNSCTHFMNQVPGKRQSQTIASEREQRLRSDPLPSVRKGKCAFGAANEINCARQYCTIISTWLRGAISRKSPKQVPERSTHLMQLDRVDNGKKKKPAATGFIEKKFQQQFECW